MGEDGGLLHSFSCLGNEIIAERDQHVSEGARHLDTAFDLLAMILRHYHEEYCPRRGIKSCLGGLLIEHPWAAHSSPVPTEVVREWVLSRCDAELEPISYKIIDELPREYLTFLWVALSDLKVVLLPRGHDTDDQKVRSILVGLGFNEPYRPRWGFNYICHELEEAQHALLNVDTNSVDSEIVGIIRDNTILAFKCFKRFFRMLLSFYGQYLFENTECLVAALKPDVARPQKYLEKSRLQDHIELVSLLERSTRLIKGKPEGKEPSIHIEVAERLRSRAKIDDESWREFSELIVIKRDLIDGVRQACESTVAQLKLGTRATYKPEEVVTIRGYILNKLIGHLMGLRSVYCNSFPRVVALKMCRQDEDKRVRIDYIDETGSWDFIRKDMPFQPRGDFYLYPRLERSPIVLPVEGKHQEFIIKNNQPLESQLDDTDLRQLFQKFVKCQKALSKSLPRQVGLVMSVSVTSPLAKLGISQDGQIFDEVLLTQAIKRSLQDGETDMIEFKAGPSDDREIAKELAALANTKGGVLVLGLPDKPAVSSKEWNQAVSGRDKLRADKDRNNFFARIGKIAKGPPGQLYYCSPPVTYVPHVRDANQYLNSANDEVILVVVLPIPQRSPLCTVTGLGVMVRLPGSCEKIKPEWQIAYDRHSLKPWIE